MPPTDHPESLSRRTLRRRWLPILTQWSILTAALLCAAYATLGPTYRASALLRVDPTPILLDEGERPVDVDLLLKTQVELLRSSRALTTASEVPRAAALARIAHAVDPAAELREVIRVEIRPGTHLIEVSMAGPSASEAATLVNAVVSSFTESDVEWAGGMARGKIKVLEAYLNQLLDQSTELERRWKSLASSGEGVRLKFDAAIEQALRERFEGRLVENEVRRVEAVADLEGLRRGDGASPVLAADLEARIAACIALDKALRARLASLPDRRAGDVRAADEVDIASIRRRLETLSAMQGTVTRRLEQAKFEAEGEYRTKIVQLAIATPKPSTPDPRPWLMTLIPFATFAATFALFAGIEARAAGRPGPVAEQGESR